MPLSAIARLRKICLALPEAHEVEAWGTPTFRVKNKMFAMFADAGTHVGKGKHGVWCKAAPGDQSLMVKANPKRYFVPPYMGPSGWVGVYLDGKTNWKDVAAIVADGYRLVAPKRLLAGR